MKNYIDIKIRIVSHDIRDALAILEAIDTFENTNIAIVPSKKKKVKY